MQRLLFAGVALVLCLPAQTVHAQKEDKHIKDLMRQADTEYKFFFNKPEKTIQFWVAINFEVGLGKFELAGLHLKLLMEKAPAAAVDTDLVQIQQSEGYEPFLRLQQIQNWSDNANFQVECEKNVKLLLKRLTAAVEVHLERSGSDQQIHRQARRPHQGRAITPTFSSSAP